jgi:tight adherence protein B
MDTFTLLTIVFAVAAALFSYVFIEFGTTALTAHREQFTQRAGTNLRDMFLFFDAKRLYVANLAAVAMAAVITFVFTESLVMMLLVASLAFFGPQLSWKWLRKRRLRKLEMQLPDALLLLAGGLRAGVSLSTALLNYVGQSSPPLSQELELVIREQRLGVTLDESLTHLQRRVPTQTMTLVVSAIRISNETGGGLAETLERTSQTLRSKLQVEGKIDALTAQGKLQAFAMSALPLIVMYMLFQLEPDAMGKLWTTHIGWATCAAIVFFEGIGVYLIRKIVAIDV